jgi:hypothetical protein
MGREMTPVSSSPLIPPADRPPHQQYLDAVSSAGVRAAGPLLRITHRPRGVAIAGGVIVKLVLYLVYH